ncbi:hypothetical protein [Corynebacterium coyleae]|uniref:Uncharacterized protein n=1 Tax=Corynebacterium coyleae TaxID=53374 RepID=A0ABX8KSV6_9CORY|nr:hypothetical protein [Corynebacterium coyleae]QXB17562.1 hypothetical protein I6L55_06325 [Corynebacterium coyleae]
MAAVLAFHLARASNSDLSVAVRADQFFGDHGSVGGPPGSSTGSGAELRSLPELDWLAAVQAPHSNWVRDLLNGRIDGDAVSQTIGLDTVGGEIQVRGDTRVGNSCSAHHLDVMAISLVQSHEQALLATRRKVVAYTPVAPDETGQQKQCSLPRSHPWLGLRLYSDKAAILCSIHNVERSTCEP